MCKTQVFSGMASKTLLMLLFIANRCMANTAITSSIQHNRFLAEHLVSIGFDGSSTSSSSTADGTAQSAEPLDSLPRLLSEGLAFPEADTTPGAYAIYSTNSALPTAETASSTDIITSEQQNPAEGSNTEEDFFNEANWGYAGDPAVSGTGFDQPGSVAQYQQPNLDSTVGMQPFEDAGAGGSQDSSLQSASRFSTQGATEGTVLVDEPSSRTEGAQPVTGGHVAGIVIGVAAVAGVAGLALMWHKKQQTRREDYIGRYQRYGEVELS